MQFSANEMYPNANAYLCRAALLLVEAAANYCFAFSHGIILTTLIVRLCR